MNLRAGRRAALRGVVSVALVTLCGCVSVAPRALGRAERLYAINGGEASITEVDPANGRAIRTTAVAGARPWQAIAGPNGTLLVLSIGAGSGHGELRLVQPAARGRAGGATPGEGAVTATVRRVEIESGMSVELLAGDGAGRAVVAYGPTRDGRLRTTQGTAACRLGLLDGSTGSVLARHDVCDPRTERVLALALEPSGTASVVYAAVWRTDPTGHSTARLVVVRVAGGDRSSIPLGSAALHGVPALLSRIIHGPTSTRINAPLSALTLYQVPQEQNWRVT